MKNTTFATAALTAIVLVGLTGCSTDDVTSNGDSGPDLAALAGDRFAVADGMDAITHVDDATFDHPIKMNPPFHGGSFSRHHAHPKPDGAHVGRILKELGITRDQMFEIMRLVWNHVERIREQLEGLRDANQALIDAANEQREAIIASYHNSEITRDEAEQQLRELSQATREAIRGNPDNAPFFQAICESKRSLFDEIRNVLSPDQQNLWDAWTADLPGVCFGSEMP